MILLVQDGQKICLQRTKTWNELLILLPEHWKVSMELNTRLDHQLKSFVRFDTFDTSRTHSFRVHSTLSVWSNWTLFWYKFLTEELFDTFIQLDSVLIQVSNRRTFWYFWYVDAASGGSDDWAHGVANIKYSYTIELRDTGDHGFVLPKEQIIPTGEETMLALVDLCHTVAQERNLYSGPVTSQWPQKPRIPKSRKIWRSEKHKSRKNRKCFPLYFTLLSQFNKSEQNLEQKNWPMTCLSLFLPLSFSLSLKRQERERERERE